MLEAKNHCNRNEECLDGLIVDWTGDERISELEDTNENFKTRKANKTQAEKYRTEYLRTAGQLQEV